MKRFIYILLAMAVFAGAYSCSEGSAIGNSLTEETVVIIVDSNYTVTGKTQPIDSVQSRTLSQLIGDIDARGFGSIYSDFVGQFMPSLSLDTTDIIGEEIDSVKMFMQMVRGSFVGDSLVPMGLRVYPLKKDLPYPIYSNFDPTDYYDPSEMLCQGVYTASTMSEPDSLKKLAVVYCSMDIPKEFGTNLLNRYKSDPAAFANPEIFARDVFKGVYVKSSFGSGRISDFTTTSLRFYYHKSEYNKDSLRYDTVTYVGDYFAITPEVVVNNNIRYKVSPQLKALVDQGDNIVAAPVGYEIEIRFPGPELVETYRNAPGNQQVLNTLTMTIPVEKIDNDFDIAPPPYVLMILKGKKQEFFANNSLTDNQTSFYAAYDSNNKCYTFNALRDYLNYLLAKETITEDDYTFVITPVQLNTEASSSSGYYASSSQVVSSIVPYVSTPAMGKILLDQAKIKLTFSTNTGKIY